MIQWLMDGVRLQIESRLGLSADDAAMAASAVAVVVILLVAFVGARIARAILAFTTPGFIRRILRRRDAKLWKEALDKRRFFRRASQFAGALIVWLLAPVALAAYTDMATTTRNILEAYMTLSATLVVSGILRAAGDVIEKGRLRIGVSLEFARQSAQVVVWIVGVILIISFLFDTSVTVLLSGLAGMTAVLLLVFKDSILGFVAGIQLAGNDLLREGDWIEVPQYGADGDVLDIGLTTVKVQNFDRTISTVPSYSLISASFKNWRGMTESSARRIMRNLAIDMDSICFLTEEQIKRLRKITVLESYLDERLREIESFNAQLDESHRARPNMRGLTNIGVFRIYLQKYLESHPDIRQDMTTIVRQMPPGANGLPLQIYTYSARFDWAAFEAVQADIFDHVLAIMPEFGLRTFQAPTNHALMIADRAAPVG